MSKNKTRASRPQDRQLPQSAFDPIINRTNELLSIYKTQWPDGVNPETFLNRHVAPIVRWYNSGDRSPSLLAKMREVQAMLEVEVPHG